MILLDWFSPPVTQQTSQSDRPKKLYRNPVFLAEERRNHTHEH